MKRSLMLAAVLLLPACDREAASGDPAADGKIEAGEVALVARAPDGTRLWAVRPIGAMRRVYFASSGDTQTSHAQSCGKNCTRIVDDSVSSAPALSFAIGGGAPEVPAP